MQTTCGAPPQLPAGDCSCYARPAGLYTIAGVSSVYCQDGAALLQHYDGCSTYGFSNRVSPQQCGYLSVGSVRALAAFGTGVRLVDAGRGEAESGDAAVRALIDGTSWHIGDVKWTGTWSFVPTTCAPSLATGWPNMNHACGNINGVHWGVGQGHSSVYRTSVGSSTWLLMQQHCNS